MAGEPDLAFVLLQVCKVYIGSFNADRPVRTDLNPAGAELFEKEQADLLQDLFDIPQRACDRKARAFPPPLLVAHACCDCMSHVRMGQRCSLLPGRGQMRGVLRCACIACHHVHRLRASTLTCRGMG